MPSKKSYVQAIDTINQTGGALAAETELLRAVVTAGRMDELTPGNVEYFLMDICTKVDEVLEAAENLYKYIKATETEA